MVVDFDQIYIAPIKPGIEQRRLEAMKSYDRSDSRQRSNLLRLLHNELNLGEVLILLENIFSILADNSGVTGISKFWLIASASCANASGTVLG